MNENLITVLSISIPALVTIGGFLVTYFLNKRNFKEELRKQKSNIQLDKISELPVMIQTVLKEFSDSGDVQKALSEFKILVVNIFAYGSIDAIALSADMQESTYQARGTDKSKDIKTKYKPIAYYILLLCQIKYDLTGIEVNPEYWYRINFTDYAKTKLEFKKINNDIVTRLNLQNFLFIQ